jgi:Golgi nucleoside diphosphatase
LKKVTIRFQDGSEKDYHIFVNSFLGFGANEALNRYHVALSSSTKNSSIIDPCLPKGLFKKETKQMASTFNGSGDFAKCFELVAPLINKTACTDLPCLFNGVHAPLSNMRNHKFIGVSGIYIFLTSEFWYTVFNVYHLGGTYDYKELMDAAKKYCSTPWKQIILEQKSDTIEELERLEAQCFKTAYIINMLHKGLNLPYDAGNIYETVENFEEFGEFSSTLGAIFILASSTIPPKKDTFSLNYFPVSIMIIIAVMFVVTICVYFIRKHKTKVKRLYIMLVDYFR